LFLVFFLFIFLILVNSSLVNAVGISIQHDRSFEFEPGLEFSIRFAPIYPTRDSIIKISGEFAEYATLSRTHIPLEDPDKEVIMHVKIPDNAKAEDFTPGTNKIWVEARDDLSNVQGDGGMFVLSTSGGSGVNIFVPYPGFYIDIIDFSVSSVNSGENSELLFTAWNRGNNDLTSMHYDFAIKDKDNNILLEKSGSGINIMSQEKQKVTIPLLTYSFNPGHYNATLNYFYLDKIVSKTVEFKIGKLNVDIVNTTQVLFNDSIQQFDIKVRSDWNDIIKGVYGVVNFNGIESKTSPIDLSNFETKTLTTYIDTSNNPIGNYNLNVTLFYSDEEKTGLVNLELIERPPEEVEKEPVSMILIILIVIVGLLLIAMVLFILFYIKREHNNGKSKDKKK